MINIKILIKNIRIIKINLKKKLFLLKTKNFLFLIKKYIFINIVLKKLNINNIFKKLIKYYIKILKNKVLKIITKIPNISNKKTPYKNYIIIKKWGKSKYIDKDHIYILNKFNKLKITSKKYINIYDPLLELYKSLIKFILKINKKEHNFIEINSNYILSFKDLINSGQLPNFKNELYKIKDNKYLLPTSEVSLINLFKNKFIDSNLLPIKLLSQSRCFRNEKKNYGKKNKGLLRQNEFNKIELILITDLKNSYHDTLEILKFSEKLLKKLKLKYRIILLSSNDINLSAAKTYDIEIWSPYLKSYVEISSTTNTESFQSVRLNLKYIYYNNLINSHIINSSSLAIGRLFAIVIETYYYKEKLKIPKVLRKYNNNNKFI